MILSRTKPVEDPTKKLSKFVRDTSRRKPDEMEEFISQRDYMGAIACLQFCRDTNIEIVNLDLWIGFAAFHAGNYQRALDEYENILENHSYNDEIYIYIACCYFMLGKYDDAEQIALKGPNCSLRTRVLFHIAYKQNNETKYKQYHDQLQKTIEDQLCLASMYYMKGQYQDALEIYKKYLTQNRNYVALNVYIALCYYKLEYYDMSQDLLEIFLQTSPHSPSAVNLRACNHYRLFNSQTAENDLKIFFDQTNASFNYAEELFQHNMVKESIFNVKEESHSTVQQKVVFQSGTSALQVLPKLIGIIPEARLNLIIYYLKQDILEHAFDLIKDIDPKETIEFILKGIVNVIHGQEHHSHEHIRTAQSYLHTIGSSPDECDTIPGRQCMASVYFLENRFYDALVYLNSIKTYFFNDDTFNFNYAQSKAREEKWLEAEETFLLIQNEKIKNDIVYLTWLARCFIYNKKARLAWELYLRLEQSNESYSLLELIANDCYKCGCFLYAARAFDVLDRIRSNPRYWDGKLGACAGVFQQIIAGHESPNTLSDILSFLRNKNRPQGDQMVRVLRSWARTNNISV